MIIFVRHGQTKDNAARINSGRRDVPLNKLGKIQAKECGEILQGEKFDVVYCSPLKRARQTAKRIMKYHKHVPIFYDERLLEREDGSATGMKHDDTYPVFAWDFKKKYKFENFEQPMQMYKRVAGFLDEILKKHEGQKVLIVAHDGVGKVSRMYFEGLPESKNLDGFLFDFARPYVLSK